MAMPFMMNAEQYAMKMNGRGRACLACRLRGTINCLPGTSSPIIAVSWRSLTVLANADLIGGKSAGLDTNRPAVASVEPVARGRRLPNSCSHTSRSNYKYSTNAKMDAKAPLFQSRHEDTHYNGSTIFFNPAIENNSRIPQECADHDTQKCAG
jgi:hypothetical protein